MPSIKAAINLPDISMKSVGRLGLKLLLMEELESSFLGIVKKIKK